MKRWPGAVLCMYGLIAAGRALAALGDPDPADQALSLRPPHGEMPPTFYEAHKTEVWSGGVLVGVMIAAGAWYLTRPRSRTVLPPQVEARRDLNELRDRPETGAVLSRLSHVLRHYFERAFELGEGEMTTAEITFAAERSARVGPALAASMKDFLLRCDRVKFAPHGPEPPLGAVAEALRLVDAGEARLAEVRVAETKRS